MSNWFVLLHPVWQALLAGLFTWAVTAIGAAMVFWTAPVNRKLLDAMLDFSGGVMLAATSTRPDFFQVLIPVPLRQHGLK